MAQDSFSGQRGGDLDWFGRGQMVSEFEESAFMTPPGQLAPLTETQFGYHVILVTGERAAGTTPLEEVQDDLLNELRARKAEDDLVAEADRIRGLIDSPGEFDAVATEQGLEILRSFVNEDEGMRELGASSEFRTAVMAMEAGEISAPLRISRGLALVVVEEIVPESVAPLDDVEERVRTDILNDRAQRAARTTAEQALEHREDFAEAVAALSAEAQDSGELAPGQVLPGTGGSSLEMQEALFGDAVTIGDRGVVEVPAGALVYEVATRQPFDPIAFEGQKETLREELVQQRRLGMRRSMVDELSGQLEIVINEPLVQRLDGGA
jgi:peptidyl-prolyl cis-trans isomerase D